MRAAGSVGDGPPALQQTAAQKPAVEVRRITDELAEQVAEFYRAVWEPSATGAGVRAARAAVAAANPLGAGQDPPAFVFLADGKVLGHLGTIPVRFWNGEAELDGYWLKGFMVLPEHRNGPVGFAVLKEMLNHVGLSGIVTVAPAARRLFTAVGYADCGTVPNYVAVLRPGRVLRALDVAALGLGLPAWTARAARLAQRSELAWLGGALGGLGLAAWRRAWCGRSASLGTDSSGTLPPHEALDVLWRRARATLGAAAVRDGTFLRWRYDPAPGSTYEAVSVRGAAGEVDAVAVVRRPRAEGDERLRGIRVASLSDILFPVDRPDAGLAVLAGAERVARRMGADAMLCTASHPALARLLPRRGYARLPGNVHLMIRDPKGAAALPTAFEEWWATRGDANSDEVF